MTSSALLDHKLNVPDDHTVAQAAEAVDILDRFLRERPDAGDATVRLVADETKTTVEIPGEALRLLVDVLAQIANGNACECSGDVAFGAQRMSRWWPGLARRV